MEKEAKQMRTKMDVNNATRIRNNFSQLFAPLSGNNQPNKSDLQSYDFTEDDIPPSLSSSSPLRMLKEIGDKTAQILALKNELAMKPILKEYFECQAVALEATGISDHVMNCMEVLHASAHVIEQALKDPTIQDSLPLRYDLHRKTIESIEACIWLIQNKKWSPLDFEVEWSAYLTKLQHDVEGWVSTAKQLDKDCRELQDLKVKMNTVLKTYPNLEIL